MSDSVFEFLNFEKTSCEFKDKVYDVSTSLETQEKCFKNEEGKEYFIIENELQISGRLLKNGKEINFKRCIFVCKKIQFLGSIKKDIIFNNAIFCEDVHFDFNKFKGHAVFLRALFEKDLYFMNCNFDDTLLFDCSIFKGKVNFFGSKFYNGLQATLLCSEKDFSFSSCIFEGKLAFNASEFKERLLFHGNDTLVNGHMSFYKSIVKYLLINDLTIGEKFSITFLCAKIQDIDYGKTNFTNATDRETFLILKEMAIKKHDHISALNFYKNEMQAHTKKLEENKGLDYWLLKFEKEVSDFGTNPIKPILWIISLAFVFSLVITFFTNSWNAYLLNSFLLMNPTLSIKSILEISIPDNKNIFPILEIINLFKNIMNGILIYEIIKSFRKFSRKL